MKLRWLFIILILLTSFWLMPQQASAIEGEINAVPLLRRNGDCDLWITGTIEGENEADARQNHEFMEPTIADYFQIQILDANETILYSVPQARYDGVLHDDLGSYHLYQIVSLNRISDNDNYFTLSYPLTVQILDTYYPGTTPEIYNAANNAEVISSIEILPSAVVHECMSNIEPWITFTGDVEMEGATCADARLGMSYQFTAQTDDQGGNDWIALISTDGTGLPLDVSFFYAPLFSQIPTGNIIDVDFVYPISARPVTVTMYDVADPTQIVQQFGLNSPRVLEFIVNSTVMVSDTWDPATEISECAELLIETPRACSVNTFTGNSVSVRVGPGINRSAILSLPVASLFGVVGMGFANDGSLWLRMNKEELAPNSSASELWVALEDVVLSGDCTLLEQLTAPPIIPIIETVPDTSDETSADGGDAGSTVDGISASMWVITTFTGSIEGPCINSAQDGSFVESYTSTFRFQPSADESSITVTWFFSGNNAVFELNRTSGSTYVGVLSMPAINTTRTYTWTFTTPTSLQGTLVTASGACVFYDTMSGQVQ